MATLHGHKERVNCVKWISHRQTRGRKKQASGQTTTLVSDQATAPVPGQNAAQVSDQATALVSKRITELVSGAVDKDVIVWRERNSKVLQ